MDALTQQIVQQIDALPFNKKKALLQLLKQEQSSVQDQLANGQEDWKKKLLSTSVWTDAEIQGVQEARNFINQWQPKSFSTKA